MVEHSHIRAFVGPRLTHRVGKQLSTYSDLMPLGAGPFDKCVDVFSGNTAFDEDSFDVLADDQIDERIDTLQTGFRLRRDALNALNVESIRAAEVIEGVMRRDQYATLARNGSNRFYPVLMQLVELFPI